MYIAYFDETGDDGYPRRETELFILTSGYVHHESWQSIYKSTLDFRKHLRGSYQMPVKLEMHTKHFLLNKNPYRQFRWDESTRLKIIQEYADFIASLDMEFINVVINKSKITASNQSMYRPVLDERANSGNNEYGFVIYPR